MRSRRAGGAWWPLPSFWCFVLCLLAACGAGSPRPGGGDLLAGKAPHASAGVRDAASLTDGVAAPAGDDWETHLTARFDPEDASVTYDLGAIVSVRAIWFQGDHNDDYRFMISEDGAVFEQLWDAPRVKAAGMQERSTSQLDGRGRFLRVQPARGDGRYAISELAVFESVPAAFPPEVPRRRGTSLEVIVRTKVLLFAAAAMFCLAFAYRGAPGWWLVACGALPLLAGADAVLAVLRAWPVEQRQVSIVRAAAAALAGFAVLREVFGPPRFRPQRAVVAGFLGLSGVLAVLAFYNLGQPQFWDNEHRQPTPVHLLDLRQYYGTVKYFDEIGYRGLYAADVAAYLDDHPEQTLEQLHDMPMRDLDTHRMSTVGAQREKIEVIRERFSPERWEEYKRDARYFRDTMGEGDYLHYMLDFGGNATPVWIGMARLLFGTLDASTSSFLITGLLDPLLFLVTFLAIWRCFGFRTMAVVMVVFGANDFIMYGTNWGGATLRHDWLMYIGLGACALRRERWALGGFFLALSTMIRAFPILTLVAATFPALWWAAEHKRDSGRWPTLAELRAAQRPILRVLGAALITAVLLLLVTSLRWSLPAWTDWLAKVAKLNADSHGNSIALRGLVAGWEIGHQQLLAARWPLLAAGALFFVGGVGLTCRGKPLERAAVAGSMLVPVLFYAANYYIHIVCFLPLLAVERSPLVGAGAPRAAGDAHSAASAPAPPSAPLSPADAWVWLVLLGLCVAQYWTVLVTELGLHFHLATVLLFGALTAILVVQVRADVREGRLERFARFFGVPGGAAPEPALALVEAPAAERSAAERSAAVSPALQSAAVESAPRA